MNRLALILATILLLPAAMRAADAPFAFKDPKPQRYELTARASAIDPRAQPPAPEHPDALAADVDAR